MCRWRDVDDRRGRLCHRRRRWAGNDLWSRLNDWRRFNKLYTLFNKRLNRTQVRLWHHFRGHNAGAVDARMSRRYHFRRRDHHRLRNDRRRLNRTEIKRLEVLDARRFYHRRWHHRLGGHSLHWHEGRFHLDDGFLTRWDDWADRTADGWTECFNSHGFHWHRCHWLQGVFINSGSVDQRQDGAVDRVTSRRRCLRVAGVTQLEQRVIVFRLDRCSISTE